MGGGGSNAWERSWDNSSNCERMDHEMHVCFIIGLHAVVDLRGVIDGVIF